MHKDKITREIRRQIKEENNAFKHMMKICNHFFKDLFKQLKSVDDPRHGSYITYNTFGIAAYNFFDEFNDNKNYYRCNRKIIIYKQR